MTELARRVLVVDDDDDFRQSVTMALEEEGWSVCEARHGGEALTALDTFGPSIMLLDWRMPVMDGRAVLEHTRDRPRPQIVLVSAGADLGALAARHRVGFHLNKPFALDELLQLLERALGQGPAAGA